MCIKCGNPCPVGADFKNSGVQFRNPGSYVMKFEKVRQGKFADCWFVAALSSFIFTQPPKYTPEPDNNGMYTFRFFGGKKAVPIEISGDVCVDATNNICGAMENDGGTIYSWPAVYEKAFAAFREDSKNPPDPPNIKKYIDCDGNPLSCLEILTGRGQHVLFTDSPSEASIQNFILSKTNPETAGSDSVYVPFVAWTYPDVARVTYPNLKVKHSYSILGLFESDIKYIILRDPQLENCPIGQNIEQALTWTYTNLAGLPTPVNTLNNEMGIFALKVADFKTNFEALGYVE